MWNSLWSCLVYKKPIFYSWYLSHVFPSINLPGFSIIPSLQWFLTMKNSIKNCCLKKKRPHSANMGMTTKSHPRRSSFDRYRWWNSPGSSLKCCQNKVSKSLILRFPQTSLEAQLRKQSLFQLDGSKTINKGTYWSPRVTCVSESHLLSFFNLSKSWRENFSKLGIRNFTPRTMRVGLHLWRSVSGTRTFFGC